jgi:hypothetical protein
MPTIINIQNADSKAQDIYVLQLQIREATQKLSMPTLGNVPVTVMGGVAVLAILSLISNLEIYILIRI